jgi:glycosyltransferase involved in cell wall biosynthesis
MSSVNNSPKIVGVILAYKHAGFLLDLYKRIPKYSLSQIIIADDYSGDGIEKVAASLGIPCYSHSRLGYGGNIKYGILKAIELGADYIVEIHGDGQYEIEVIPQAVAKASQGCGLLLGSRFTSLLNPLRDAMPWSRYFANIGLSAIAKLVLQLPLSEFHSGFRIYSKEFIQKVNLSATSNDFLFSFEIIALAAFHKIRVGEVPIRCFYDKNHTSITIWKSTVYAFQMLGVLAKYIAVKLGFKTSLFGRR